MSTIIRLSCFHCKKEFFDFRANKRKYCSHKCYSLSRTNRIKLICETCKKSFSVTPGEIEKGKIRGKGVRYCSRECWIIAQLGNGNRAWKGGDKLLTCDWCKSEFARPRTWSSYEKTFCSPECRKVYLRADGANTSNWQGGITPAHEMERKSFIYKDWRKAVFERDNYTCRKCGKRGTRLHAHHLYRFSEFKHLRYSIENGHTLCRDCHKSIRGKENNYLLSIGFDPKKPPLF